MIKELRKRFVLVTSITVAAVFGIVFACVALMSISQMDGSLDSITSVIAENGGEFGDPVDELDNSGDELGDLGNLGDLGEASDSSNGDTGDTGSNLREPFRQEGPRDRGFSRDTQLSTRYFVVWMGWDGEFSNQDTKHVSSVTESQALEYAREAFVSKYDTGWIGDFRYRVASDENGKIAVFVSGEREKSSTFSQLNLILILFIISFLVIFVLIFIVSKRVVKPIADSYDRQKQFVTNASHELKTPLTIMMSDLDIVESEVGKSEWIDDIRAEGSRMGSLINQLVSLARMDEQNTSLDVTEFSLSDLILDSVSEFESSASKKSQTLKTKVCADAKFLGDERLIHNLMGILMDNAVKYCDEGGLIKVSLTTHGKNHTISVENTYEGASNVDLDRIFERFYREDKARTSNGSFGVGLSIAQALAKAHHGDISAYVSGSSVIGFKVNLRSL